MAFTLFLFGGEAAAQARENAASPKGGTREAATWGDPAYPDIDYSIPFARDLHRAGASFFGWWGLFDDNSGSTESHDLLAVNFSSNRDPEDPNAAVLLAICSGGNLYLGYFPRQLSPEAAPGATASEANSTGEVADDAPKDVFQWVAENEKRAGVVVTFQIDDFPSKGSVWYKTHNGNGVILKDRFAEDIILRIEAAETMRITLTEGHRDISSTFRVVGGDAALKPVVELCSPTGTGAAPAQ
ncbi:hypothetical protein [Oricola thermophila]|nr:hypothetical protein [Oricola thermophila]